MPSAPRCREGDGRAGVGQVGDDLQGAPQAGVARERHGMEAQRDDVAHRGGGEDRETQGAVPSVRTNWAGSRTSTWGRRRRAPRRRRAGRYPRRWRDGWHRPPGRDPGFFPYQNPTTPSTRRPGSSPVSWVPPTAVAANSSLSPGEKTMSAFDKERVGPLELLVETAQGGAFVAADEERGRQVPGPVEIVVGSRGGGPALRCPRAAPCLRWPRSGH